MKDIFKSYSNYVVEVKKRNGEMGTPMKRSRVGSAPYANGRNKCQRKIERNHKKFSYETE